MTACDDRHVFHITRALTVVYSEVTILFLHFLEKGNESYGN